MRNKKRVQSMDQLIERISYAAIIGLCSLIFLGVLHNDQIRAEEEQNRAMYRAQSVIATRIQQSMNKKLLFARGLAGAVSISPDITEAEFSNLSSVVKVEDPSVVNMALVRDAIIIHVHPLDENRVFIGSDLSEVPERLHVLQEVERTGETIVEGPTYLLQGYSGFIIREPIYEVSSGANKGAFWGIASIVFAAEAFLEEIGLNSFSDRYEVSLQVKTPFAEDVILYGDDVALSTAKTTVELQFPSAAWTLAMSPRETASVPYQRLGLSFLVTLTGAIIALLAARGFHALRRRQRRTSTQLQAALSAAPSGFAMFDVEDKLELCNQRYIELHGMAADAMPHGSTLKTILEIGLKEGLYLDAIGNEKAWLSDQLTHGSTGETGRVLALSNGTWMQQLDHETPEGGRVSILNDVTAVLSSRERAKVAEQRLNDAIDALPVGFWLFDSDDKLMMFNAVAGERLDGMKRNLAKGRELRDMVARRMETAAEVRLNGEPVDDIVMAVNTLIESTSDLEVRYEDNRWFKYFSRRTSEGGLVMFRVEITDLQRHQQELESSNTELRAALSERDEAEARLNDVSDLSSEWFWEQDADMRITYVSEGFTRTMGVGPSEYIGKLRTGFSSNDESELGGERSVLYCKMRAHEPFRDVVYSHRFRPDVLSWIRISGKPRFDDAGEFIGYIGIAEDVTKFYAALREAEQADEAKTQFLNVISHELRTPLSAVLGFNSFIANFEKLPSYNALNLAMTNGDPVQIEQAFHAFEDNISQFTRRIQAAGTQLKSLIDDMLDLARIEANTIDVTPTKLNSKKVVESVVDQMQAMADEKGLTIPLDLVAADVWADEIRLRQILTNLLGNAFKFTDIGTVTVRSRVKDNMVVFEVIDTGIGISQDRVGIVFDRFAQAAQGTNRPNAGVGLGLTICKDLVGLQNGWIEVESELGIGTTFIFAIPLWREGE
ncbi:MULTISPECIES: sensor histidine kinase [Pacificibacter]|uniref:sensor histidine kinase n=1 Tax=Pacificibacter TaxID=1042323 RepID=UPI001C081F93|nr:MULTISPECIES: ATP-binding protein [Pacificibacter]MBU2937532.1 PAS-domain containing protein [Pacificibacter marinus]MDO6616663.1 ATP-binding protein [Pacificibacter sp. 1_MG-2023]